MSVTSRQQSPSTRLCDFLILTTYTQLSLSEINLNCRLYFSYEVVRGSTDNLIIQRVECFLIVIIIRKWTPWNSGFVNWSTQATLTFTEDAFVLLNFPSMLSCFIERFVVSFFFVFKLSICISERCTMHFMMSSSSSCPMLLPWSAGFWCYLSKVTTN